MVETSAHRIVHILPAVSVRLWVLSFPRAIRFLLSTRPETVTPRLLAIVVRATCWRARKTDPPTLVVG